MSNEGRHDEAPGGHAGRGEGTATAHAAAHPRLMAMARAAAQARDVDGLVEIALDLLLDIETLDAVTLLTVDPRTRTVLPMPSRGARRSQFSIDDDVDAMALCAQSVAQGAPVVVTAARTMGQEASRGSRQHICLPLRAAPGDAADTDVLAVVHVVSRPSAQPSLEAVSQMCDLFALALQNATRVQHVERQNRILRGLNEVADLLNLSPRLQETLGVTLSRVLALVHAESGSVFTRNASGHGFSRAAHHSPPGALASDEGTVAVGEGDVGEVLERGQTRVWRAREDDPYRVHACVPLRSKGEILGALKVSCLSRDAFEQEELEFLERLGGQVGLAVESGQQFQIISEQAARLSRRTGHLAALLETSEQMAGSVELEANLQSCVQRLGEMMAVPIVLVLLDQGDGQARIVSAFVEPSLGRRGRGMRIGLCIPWHDLPTASRAMQNQRLVIVEDGQEGPSTGEQAWMRFNDVRSALVLPIIVNGQAQGSLILASPTRPRLFYPSELDFTRTVSNQLGMAMERDRLFRAVRESARLLEARVEERTRALLETNLRLREATRLRSDFLKVMSHELRTPLNAILGFSELMADPTGALTREEVLEYSQALHQSGQSLLALINDILDLAASRPDDTKVQRENVHIDVVVAGILDVLKPQALSREVVICNEVAAPLPSLLTDRSRVKQILYNLVSNAIKFSPPAGRVTMRTAIDPSVLWLVIADEGPGIDPALHEKVFEPFFQADGGLSRSYDGAGLGLSIARRYARLLGGDVQVDSDIGQGSRFRFSIPLPP